MFTLTRCDKTKLTLDNVMKGTISFAKGLPVPDLVPEFKRDELLALTDCEQTEKLTYVLKKFFTEENEIFLAEISRNFFKGKRKINLSSEFTESPSLVYLSEDEGVIELNDDLTSSVSDYSARLLLAYLEASNKINDITVITDDVDIYSSLTEIEKNRIRKSVLLTNQKTFTEVEREKISDAIKNGGIFYKADENFLQEITEYSNENKCLNVAFLSKSSFIHTIIGVFSLITAWCDCVSGGMIEDSEYVNVAFPLNASGFLSAAIYLKNGSNVLNKVIFADDERGNISLFLQKGLVSVNNSCSSFYPADFERIFFELNGRDVKAVNDYLYNKTKETVNGIQFLTKDYKVYKCEYDHSLNAIAEFFDEFGYVFDFYSAKGVSAANEYFNDSEDQTPIVYLSAYSSMQTPIDTLLGVNEKSVANAKLARKHLSMETGEEITPYFKKLSDDFADTGKIFTSSEIIKELFG